MNLKRVCIALSLEAHKISRWDEFQFQLMTLDQRAAQLKLFAHPALESCGENMGASEKGCYQFSARARGTTISVLPLVVLLAESCNGLVRLLVSYFNTRGKEM